MSLVGVHVALLAHAKPFGDAQAGDVGIIAPEADAQSAALAEQGADRRRRSFENIPLPQMGLVAEVADQVARQVGIGDADIDLADKASVFAAKYAEKRGLADLCLLVETANCRFGFSLGGDRHRRVVPLMTGKVCPVAQRHRRIPDGIVLNIAT